MREIVLTLMPVRPGDLVRAQFGPGVRELAEDGHRSLHHGDLAGGWLTGSGHVMISPEGKWYFLYGNYIEEAPGWTRRWTLTRRSRRTAGT
jgi:hypothetical protein